ncbi:MAG: thioredoxin-disulfide reductase [Proteobacteria bacterium]|nr:thioredoxin-disulfide reductase [Pseudomonadota bacterium]
MYDVLVIGSGPAGNTAAIYAVRSGLKVAMVRGQQPGGQLTITTEIENFPGFAEPVQGSWLMEQMEAQTKNCGAEIIDDIITKADLKAEAGAVHILFGEKAEYQAKSVIIATGASAKWLGLDAEKQFAGKGVSGCATCDGPFFRNQVVGVVGGGSTALEEALYLSGIAKEVHLIHRNDKFKSEVVLLEKAKQTENIKMHTFRQLIDIEGKDGPLGGVETAILEDPRDGSKEKIDMAGIFIAIGHKPNTDIFKGQLDLDEIGFIKVEKGTANTNIPSVFAAGDVADPTYRQAIVAAGSGCVAAIDSYRYLKSI